MSKFNRTNSTESKKGLEELQQELRTLIAQAPPFADPRYQTDQTAPLLTTNGMTSMGWSKPLTRAVLNQATFSAGCWENDTIYTQQGWPLDLVALAATRPDVSRMLALLQTIKRKQREYDEIRPPELSKAQWKRIRGSTNQRQRARGHNPRPPTSTEIAGHLQRLERSALPDLVVTQPQPTEDPSYREFEKIQRSRPYPGTNI